MVADEIKRVQGTYGETAILLQGDGHGEAKNVHVSHGCNFSLFDKIGVAYTTSVRNPDSWEGFYWGAKHVWGNGWMGMAAMYGPVGDKGTGNAAGNALLDFLQNGDMIVWAGDWETTPQGFNGQSASLQLFFMNEIGIKQIYLTPDLNFAAAVHAYKWIPILPNTDMALFSAILYIWIQEGTFNQDYLDTHAVGWDADHMPDGSDTNDNFKDYILGTYDGVPKTPEWASPRCNVPVYTIKALAREWASNKTSFGQYYGSAISRGPYSQEPARFVCALLAAQGMGGPGIHQIYGGAGMPRRAVSAAPGSTGGMGGYSLGKQNVPKTLHPEAILLHDMDNPLEFWGSSSQAALTADQFRKYTYPIAAEEGGAEIHMIWGDTVCHTACWPDSNNRIKAYRSPKIECIVYQHPTFENDCVFGDIILPVNTMLEEEDVISTGSWIELANFMCLAHIGPGVASIGESKSDYETAIEIAKKLGTYGAGNAYELYTGGNTIEETIQSSAEASGAVSSGLVTWDQIKEKGYWLCPVADDWKDDFKGFSTFYEDPDTNPLDTPTGKLEIYCQRIAENFPDDDDRGPYPKYVIGGPDGALDESIEGELFKQYPLLMQTQHPRWRSHVQCDDCTWIREIPSAKIRGYDGYMYEPVWINPKDAEARGIKHGDIVKVYNDRGVELGAAYVTERVPSGAVHMDHGSRVDI
jgi:trimethylamine-N-oxide reductase (cytochrome c)